MGTSAMTDTPRKDGPRTRYVVDRDTLIDAYGTQSWSSPDQMADMLLDGLAKVNAPRAEAAAGPRDAPMTKDHPWAIAHEGIAGIEAFSRLRDLLTNRRMPDDVAMTVTLGELRAAFGEAAAGPRDDGLRETIRDIWNEGHRAGIGCGHDLAVCRHDEAAVMAELDDIASWNERVRAALAATTGAAPESEEPVKLDLPPSDDWRENELPGSY